MILSLGEILIDEIESTNNGNKVSEKHCGGAPFNVIYNAKKMGACVGFVGAVGNDTNGDFLCEFVDNSSLEYSLIQKINKPTTIALVTNDETGERYFKFIRKDTADYQIDFDLIPKNVLESASIIHLGSLMLNESKGRKFADKVVDYCKTNKKKLSFDVNFRTDIFSDIDEAKRIYKKYIDACDILKLSEDELEVFAQTKDLKEAVSILSKKDQLVTVTLGKNGSFYKFNESYGYADTIKVKPIDTTGAGDAFYGSFLALIDNDIDYSDTKEMTGILKKANEQGALTTLFKGAIK